MSKKLMYILGLLVIASMVLAACAPAATPEKVVETVIVTVEGKPGETVVQVVTPTPEPVAMPDTLVICMGQEPETLYPYGGSMLAMSSVLESVYDGPIDARSFDYQAVILEKLPSLADGDAVIQQVTVKEGDKVVDADGNPVELQVTSDTFTQTIMIKPSGSTEAVPYEGGEVTLDQMVVTFKMLPDLKWSDGEPLTAADSVYSFNLAADPDTPSSKYAIERTASYEALDEVTLQWTGLPGYKDATYFINFWTPYPEHLWSQYTAAELVEAEESSLRPTGWGPYVIDEWVKGDHISLHKNPNYFRADEGLPKFDNLVYRFVGENSNANIAAVLSGECDIVDQTSGLDDQSELLLELQGSGQLQATFVTGTVWEHVDFGIQNISYDDGYDVAAGDRYDFFSDVKVRQAFAMCMDRQQVVDTVLYGQSIVLDTYLPPQHPLFNANVKHYDYDPEAAKALFAEAGWTDSDGDGYLDKDGQVLEVAYETTSAALRQSVTEIIAQSLEGCGVKVNLNYYPAGEWFADGPDGKLFGRLFDLGEFAWLTGVEPPCDLYITDQVPGPEDGTWTSIMTGESGLTFPSGWGGQNETGYHNPEYDTTCKAALQSLPGQPSYSEMHLKTQEIFANDLPVVPLFLRLKLAATRPDMCGFIMDPTANSEMWNIEEFGFGPLCP